MSGTPYQAKAMTAQAWVLENKLKRKASADSLWWEVVRFHPATEAQLAARDYLERDGGTVPEGSHQASGGARGDRRHRASHAAARGGDAARSTSDGARNPRNADDLARIAGPEHAAAADADARATATAAAAGGDPSERQAPPTR